MKYKSFHNVVVSSRLWPLALVAALAPGVGTLAQGDTAAARFKAEIEPLLTENCYDCHGWGASEGNLSLDGDPADREFLRNPELWSKVLKNVRAGVMPPDGMGPLDAEQQQALARWVKADVFGIDPASIDPGPAVVRRMNRFEYRNTIRDLLGIDYNVEIEFPPDDSGFGFDNVGEAQSLSPMLVEKYLTSAKSIVDQAVPTVTRVLKHQVIRGSEFRGPDGSGRGHDMLIDNELTVSRSFKLAESGQYRVLLDSLVTGSFLFHPRRCKVTLMLDGEQLSTDEYGWNEKLKVEKSFDKQLDAGEHTLSVKLVPLPQSEEEKELEESLNRNEPTGAHYRVETVRVEGPLDPPQWQHPSNYHRFFPRDEPPASAEDRREYAAEVLSAFATRAFRRPVDEPTLGRLTSLAESVYSEPQNTFEAGVAQAMVAVLASPRFLLLTSLPDEAVDGSSYPYIDEYSLASRLSYFFWSTTPDKELMDLAGRGELRSNLDAQVERMLKDNRSSAMIREFVGQWLRARDVENVSIDPLSAMGLREEYDEILAEFRRSFRGRRGRGRADRQDQSPEEQARLDEVRRRFRELRNLRDIFDKDIRDAMRRETEMTFEHVVRKDRSALELIDSNYTFLNEELAEYYGIEGVEGRRMRKVELPEGSPRGGVLTQGTMLTVTSNPTRTSPVKRGFFILDNLLGTPPPPAPPDIPDLAEAAGEFEGREPTLREVLELHREAPLCTSCHARMDPLGLALENFDALGNWRDDENGQSIDATGRLVSGEEFKDIRELKQILKTSHRGSFYRCLTEKLLTYALGRGLDYYDTETVDRIANELERRDGRMSAIFEGIVHSAPFQRQRPMPKAEVATAGGG